MAMSKKARNDTGFQIGIELVMLILLFFSFVPIFVMLIMSFKSNWEVYNDFFALPQKISWGNYVKAIIYLYINMGNTLFVVAVAVILTIILSAIGGYVFATMMFPGKTILYYMLLALIMIPSILYLAPNYSLIQKYGLYNTRWALILPWVSSGQVIGIILCKNTIEGLPVDLFEAAKVEGCGEIVVLTRIVVPLIKPMLSTIAILKVVDYYNDFIWPMMVIETNTKQVITVAVRVFNSAVGTQDIGSMFAGYVIATIPLLILFMFTSRLYMEGLTAGAVKG